MRWTAAAAAALLVVVAIEAVVRGHLPVPGATAPATLYTRQAPWDGSTTSPVAFATVGGDMLHWRERVSLDDMPRHLVDAILAVEDQRFFEHDGLDIRRIGGAMLANVRLGRVAQGGSTVTQQLVKNVHLSAERTPIRKLREAAIAIAIEARHGKRDILEAYLNEIYLGQAQGRAIHGVGAASRFYFNKPASRLTVSEAALLAGMIRAPNRYAPHRHPAAARERRNLVLGLMREQGRIEARLARRAELARVPTVVTPPRGIDARYFRDHVRPQVPRRYRGQGAAIFTTLDARLQRSAERAVAAGLARQRKGVEAALVALDPRTGEVLAMVGGVGYGGSQFNRATEARRQPGSAFKPFVALAALERQGDDDPPFTLASVVADEPLRVRTGGSVWEPANYDRTFRGPVTMRRAMEQSLNVPFARIGLEVGAERIAATARRFGIASPLAAVPSLALGSSEVTVAEMARAYGALANGGVLAQSRVIDRLRRPGASADERPATAEPTRVADAAPTYLVTSMLEGVVRRGTARGLAAWDVALAGKTGTSNNWRDAWMIAYAPNLVVAVWVGYDDGRSLQQTGGVAALPIVSRFLADVRGALPSEFPRPDGITTSTIGAGDWAECGVEEFFLEGTEPPSQPCFEFELPEWEGDEPWADALRRGAERLMEELRSMERGRTRR